MSTLLRRDLLRKTQKELLKECKKYKISTLGNKGDIVDRILAFHASPTAQISNDGESNKKRSRRTRSNTISETSTTDKSKLTSLSSSSSSKTPKTPKIPKKKIVKIGVRGRSQSDASFTKFSSKSKKKKKTRSVSNDTTISPTFDLSKIDEKQSLSDQFNNDTLCDAINKFDIKYNQINQITDLTLKVLGIDSILQRKTILNQIEHIQKSHNQQKSVNAPSPKTKKEKQYETELNRLKKQISRQKQEYEQLKKKYDKLYKGDKGNKKDKVSSTPKTPKDKTWKPGYYKSKTPRVKHSSTIKSNKTPKMKHNVSVPVVPVIDKSKKKKKTKLNVKAPTSVKRQVSRRYDEGFGIKIKGLSALDLFLKQHDQEKKEKEENQDNKVGLSLNKDLIEQEEEEEDFETDEDFQNENDQKLENIVEAHED